VSPTPKKPKPPIPIEQIDDSDDPPSVPDPGPGFGEIYGIPTFRFNEAIKRNRQRFPPDFIFQLTREAFDGLISQNAMSKSGRGGRRALPYAFTEHGALQTANILRGERAIQMSVVPAWRPITFRSSTVVYLIFATALYLLPPAGNK
jgi:hypothetical protein